MPDIRQIAEAIEAAAPLSGQCSWDNSGWQIVPDGNFAAEATGVITCVDTTEAIVEEAAAKGVNLIVSHHPLLFRGVKSLTGATRPERTAMLALKRGIAVYAAHTSLDCAPAGVSHEMALRLGLSDIEPLDPASGLGAIGMLPSPGLDAQALAALVGDKLGCDLRRLSRPDELLRPRPMKRIALCGGSGGSLIDMAVSAGADVWISSDMSHHTFVDYAPELLLIDISHHSAELCARDLIKRAITEKFANFAVAKATAETNPTIIL